MRRPTHDGLTRPDAGVVVHSHDTLRESALVHSIGVLLRARRCDQGGLSCQEAACGRRRLMAVKVC
jgi:hypothetical protein